MTTLNITYGSTLAALKHASNNKTQIILESPSFPKIFESEEIREAWASLYFKLMLAGQTIGGDAVKSVKAGNEHVYVVCGGTVVNKIKYDKLFVFSDKNIIGLPEMLKENKSCQVIDYMKPKSLTTPHLQYLETKDSFVSKVFIRKDYRTAPIQIYVLSSLTKERLHNFEYSDTMARFKTEDLMAQNGFKGASNGRGHIQIALEVTKREVIESMSLYRDTDKIKFIYGD